MNPTNIGAIFRSAAALNMDAVLLTPACSDPLYRRAIRVSMGCVFQIPWTFLGQEESEWPQPAIQNLKASGYKTAALALSDHSVSIDHPELMADCDYTVKIPMSHGVDSLNVAAASAVAFWQLGSR